MSEEITIWVFECAFFKLTMSLIIRIKLSIVKKEVVEDNGSTV